MKPDSSNPSRPTARRRKARPWVPYLGGILLLGLLLVGFWPKPTPVETVEVQRGPMAVSVLEEGKTRIRHRHVISPPVAGFLERVPLRPGAPIRAGETVLAVIRAETSGFLNPRTQAEAEARVLAAEAMKHTRQAELERAAAALELAKKEYARINQLHRSGAVAAREWDAAETEVQVRTREARSAQFALRVAEFEIEQAKAVLLQGEEPKTEDAPPLEIRAPVDGFVLQVFEESARPVTPGMPILEVGDPQDLEAEIELLSSDAVRVQPGADVLIEHWGGSRPLRGKVSMVEPGGFTKYSALGVEEQRVFVRVNFTDALSSGEMLGDRYRVEARIIVWQAEDILQVPTGALFRRGNRWMSFVVRNGRAQLQEVEIGQNNGVDAQVLSGLQEGDRVILHPPDSLTEDSRVAIRNP